MEDEGKVDIPIESLYLYASICTCIEKHLGSKISEETIFEISKVGNCVSLRMWNSQDIETEFKQFTEMFERLNLEKKEAILRILRELNGKPYVPEKDV